MTEHRIRNKYLGDLSFYKKVLAIALPITLQSLITVGVNMMDTIMLGRVGETALSASSLANQFINIYQICCMGIGMGASVLTARFWGMRDIHSLRKAMTIMYRLCVSFAMVFTLATVFAPDFLIRIYSNEADVQAAGVAYFNWSIPTYLLLGLSLTSTIVLRSTGQVKLPLFCSIGAFFVNVFFNWVFIFGNLGAPRMEVAGAALGTVIARVFEFSIICGYLLFADKKIGYRLRHLFLKCGDLLGDYLKISIPVLISDSLLAFGNSAVAMVMGRIGQTFVSANAITMVTQQLTSVMTQGISNASGILTGQTLGEGDYRKAQEDGYRFLFLGAALGALAAGRPHDLLLQCDGGNRPDRGTAHGVHFADHRFSVHELHPDQGRAEGRRGHPFPDAGGHPVPLGGVRAAGRAGGAGVAPARVLDLFFPEDRPDHQMRVVRVPAAQRQVGEKDQRKRGINAA